MGSLADRIGTSKSRRTTMRDYLSQEVSYGGEWVTIGFVYRDLGPKLAAAWLAGYGRSGHEVRRGIERGSI